MRARTHTHTHPKHMPTPWACVWAFTDLKKSYPGLRTKNLKFQKFLALFRHFSMEYNIAQLVWKSPRPLRGRGLYKFFFVEQISTYLLRLDEDKNGETVDREAQQASDPCVYSHTGNKETH